MHTNLVSSAIFIVLLRIKYSVCAICVERTENEGREIENRLSPAHFHCNRNKSDLDECSRVDAFETFTYYDQRRSPDRIFSFSWFGFGWHGFGAASNSFTWVFEHILRLELHRCQPTRTILIANENEPIRTTAIFSVVWSKWLLCVRLLLLLHATQSKWKWNYDRWLAKDNCVTLKWNCDVRTKQTEKMGKEKAKHVVELKRNFGSKKQRNWKWQRELRELKTKISAQITLKRQMGNSHIYVYSRIPRCIVWCCSPVLLVVVSVLGVCVCSGQNCCTFTDAIHGALLAFSNYILLSVRVFSLCFFAQSFTLPSASYGSFPLSYSATTLTHTHDGRHYSPYAITVSSLYFGFLRSWFVSFYSLHSLLLPPSSSSVNRFYSSSLLASPSRHPNYKYYYSTGRCNCDFWFVYLFLCMVAWCTVQRVDYGNREQRRLEAAEWVQERSRCEPLVCRQVLKIICSRIKWNFKLQQTIVFYDFVLAIFLSAFSHSVSLFSFSIPCLGICFCAIVLLYA